jgi:hypothetical protein
MLARAELADPERKLWDAVQSGATADLRTGDRNRDDPRTGEAWDTSRQIRAQLLFELLTKTGGPADPQARTLRLAGARVTGTLDLEAATIAWPVLLMGCFFDEPITVTDASTYALRLPGCHVPALIAWQLRAQGNLELDMGFTTRGEVDLRGARIGGQLSLNGAILTNSNRVALNAYSLTVNQAMLCLGLRAEGAVILRGAHIGGQLNFHNATLTKANGVALNADSLTVDQAMLCRGEFRAEGEVNLRGAHIGGQLIFVSATVTNPNGVALRADGITVDQAMLCRGFRAEGDVILRGAHIGGQLGLEGATLTNPNGVALDADGFTVDQHMLPNAGFRAEGEVILRGAHIGGQLSFDNAMLINPNPGERVLHLQELHARALLLRPKTPPTGKVDLTHAEVGVFLDEEATWPTTLDLRGFVYHTLYERSHIPVAARLRWLNRDPAGYAPQPYEQLVAVYRQAGRDDDARKVAIAKQRRRREELNWPGKVWNSLLRWTVGYGYRTWQAGLWLLGLLAVGAAIFACAYPSDMALAKKQGDPLPAFQPWIYSLDVLLPVVNLHQEEFWIPQGVARWWAWFSILAGWLLTTVVIAALTGLLKKD